MYNLVRNMTGSFFHTFYNWSKKHISIIVLVFGIVLSGIPSNATFAATPQPGSPAATAKPNIPATQTTTRVQPGSPAATAQPNQPAEPSTSKSSDDIQCVLSSPLSGTLMGCVAQGGFMILGLAAWVLWVAAVLFNFAIPYTLNMATFLKDVPIVALGWTTFRDLANIFFIFIVLYIAISTIIGNEGFGIKKLLGKVIVGAVLINFSLFFTQAMIDVSNIFTLEFYNKITQTDGAQAAVAGTNKQTIAPGSDASKLDSGISASLVNALGLDTIWNIGKSDASTSGAKGIDPNKNAASLGLNATNLLIASLGGTILVLITAFIFFAAVIMFLARAVTLIFLMILSPIAFLGNVLPAIGKYTGEWWSKLFNNLLFAPAYMSLLYLVISIVADPNKFTGIGGGKGSFVSVFAGDSNMIGSVMTFVVLNMMMFACLIIASKFGVAGSKWAEKVGGGIAGGAAMMFSGAGLAMGLGSGALRGTAGYIGDNISSSKTLARMSSIPLFGKGAAALMQKGDGLKATKFGGKSFNEAVKEDQAAFTKRGNLIESALSKTTSTDPAKKKAAKDAGARAEQRYLGKGRFSYASNTAIKKAKKVSEGTNNKEALEELLGGKFSKEKHNDAIGKIEALNTQITTTREAIKDPAQARQISTNNARLAALIGERTELQAVVDGHLRTVEKLSNLESK